MLIFTMSMLAWNISVNPSPRLPFMAGAAAVLRCSIAASQGRLEEQTSEIQSPRDLVFPFFPDPATTDIYTLSLHDALPIYISVNPSPRLPFMAGAAAVLRCSIAASQG